MFNTKSSLAYSPLNSATLSCLSEVTLSLAHHIFIIPHWQVWAEITCKMHVALLTKVSINQLKPVKTKQAADAKNLLSLNIYCAPSPLFSVMALEIPANQ
jgi:hypothetical protein